MPFLSLDAPSFFHVFPSLGSSFTSHLLSAYHVPGSEPDTVDTKINSTLSMPYSVQHFCPLERGSLMNVKCILIDDYCLAAWIQLELHWSGFLTILLH